MLIVLVLLAAGAATVLYASVIERNLFTVRTHRVPCLPPGARAIRVLHLSDLHLRAGQRRKRRFLRRLSRLEPDLIVGTGDFLGDGDSAEAAADAVGTVRAPLGAVFVFGSNDYYGPVPKNPLRYLRHGRSHPAPGIPNPWEDLARGLEQRGWTVLSNRALERDGIEVLGLDDAHIGRADLSLATPRENERFRLVVAHSPDVLPALEGLGYDLVVCGHTHGGQVRIPGYGALVTNSALPRAMARGLHRIGDTWLHVSAGLGTSMYAPYRFACRPEVCVLELSPRR